MGYVRTAGMSTAARRARRRTALIITALLLTLVVALGASLAYMQGWFGLGSEGGSDDVAAVTTAAPTPELTSEDVEVTVLNATDRAGLAGRASEGLQVRGFSVAGVDNTGPVEGTGVIRHGAEGVEAAELLRESLPQDLPLDQDEREGSGVDLVLGPDWEDLPTPEDAEDDEPTEED